MKSTIISEEELVSLIKLNDRAGFDYLYKTYAPSLLFCINKVITEAQAAQEVLQDVFVHIWTKIDLFDREQSRLYTWMYNMAKNKAIDHSQSGENKMTYDTLQARIAERNTMVGQQHYDDKTEVYNLVAKLPKSHKDLVYMVHYKGHSIREISEQLNIPAGAVKTRLRGAILYLRNEFNCTP